MTNDTLYRVTVSHRGRDLVESTAIGLLRDLDPGTEPDTMVWSCPIMAAHAVDSIQYSYGPAFTARIDEVTR